MKGLEAQRPAPASDQTLRNLLRQVRDHGWDTHDGAAVLEHLSAVCHAAARRWRAAAGSLDLDGLSELWEYVAELLASEQDVELFPKYIQVRAGRIYTAWAAAAQTGMGSPQRRGLAGLAKQTEPLLREAVLEEIPVSADDNAPPQWLLLGGRMLDTAGWAWPIAAETALDAAASCGIESRVRGGAGGVRRSPLAGHATGVPANTWASLELLALGSSPGCRPEHRWPGIIQMSASMTGNQMSADRNIIRIVDAAVAGKAARTGRSHYEVPSSGTGG